MTCDISYIHPDPCSQHCLYVACFHGQCVDYYSEEITMPSPRCIGELALGVGNNTPTGPTHPVAVLPETKCLQVQSKDGSGRIKS